VTPHIDIARNEAQPESSIRVALADDGYLVREALSHVFDGADGIAVVAACRDRGSLERTIDAVPVDVVVTDIRMPPSESDEGLQVAAALRMTHPDMGVVVLSQYADPRYSLALLDGGSERRAYLLKERVQYKDRIDQLKTDSTIKF
jgi:DNA-binding NarL/FixJ family response regulator